MSLPALEELDESSSHIRYMSTPMKHYKWYDDIPKRKIFRILGSKRVRLSESTSIFRTIGLPLFPSRPIPPLVMCLVQLPHTIRLNILLGVSECANILVEGTHVRFEH